jgi:hypothetical protein
MRENKMAWRNCKASITLETEINQKWPNRDKSSDGTLGDAAHAARESDHNPWLVVNGVGVVRARDIDEDLDGNRTPGAYDARVLFDHLLRLARAGDARLNGGGYLIYEGKIYSERDNWAARTYTGENSHSQHIHVSFSRNQAGFDSTRTWGISTVTVPQPQPSEKDPFMALTDDQQKKLLADTAANKLMLIQIQSILLGDDPEGKGDTQARQLASLKRIEIELTDNDNLE